MGDLQPLASVRGHAGLEHRARNVCKKLPGSWELLHVTNCGTGAVLRARATHRWSSTQLRQLETIAEDATGCPGSASATADISARDQAVRLRLTWARSRTTKTACLFWICVITTVVLSNAFNWRRAASAVANMILNARNATS